MNPLHRHVIAGLLSSFALLSVNHRGPSPQVVSAQAGETVLLEDDFNGAAVDRVKWDIANIWSGTEDATINVAHVNQRLSIGPLRVNATGSHYNGVASVQAYDFTGGAASVELVQPATQTGVAYSMFAVGINSTNYYRWLVSGDADCATGAPERRNDPLRAAWYDPAAHRFPADPARRHQRRVRNGAGERRRPRRVDHRLVAVATDTRGATASSAIDIIVQPAACLTLVAPVISPAAGNYTGSVVSLASATPGAVVRYTTDGTDPIRVLPAVFANDPALDGHDDRTSARVPERLLAERPCASDLPGHAVELVYDGAGDAGDESCGGHVLRRRERRPVDANERRCDPLHDQRQRPERIVRAVTHSPSLYRARRRCAHGRSSTVVPPARRRRARTRSRRPTTAAAWSHRGSAPGRGLTLGASR